MNKTKRPLSTGRKILYILLAAAAVIGLCYLAYYLTRFTFFNEYRQYLSTYEYEDGTELTLQKKSLPGNKSYKLAAETDELQLYLNQKTSDVAIADKRTGEVTYAVPAGADDDPVANTSNKNYLKSHIIVNYFNSSRKEGIYDSWSMAVERDQVTYEGIENGVRVIYEMGDFSNSLGNVPLYLSNEKFEEILAGLEEKDAEGFARYYTDSSDVAGTRMLLKAARNNKMTKKKLTAMLDSVGFTEEDCAEQMALAGSAVAVPVSFVVALEYRLEGDHLDVSVPVCRIEERGGSSIYRIQVLRSFGAQDSSAEGYLVVPNGDGSIIRFNNGKTGGGSGNYSQYIYGIDPLAADYIVLESSNDAAMGLFGMCTDKGTILATIEDGASLASVTAGVSGLVNNYNYVYPAFILRGSETLEMFGTTGNESTLPIVEPEPYDHNLQVRYTFLDAEHQGYVGMASYLRQRLISQGVLTEKTENGDIKLYCDILAGVELTEFFLGKQYMGLTAMTTFREAEQISDILAEKGIANQVMNLQGWFNGGYYHDVASKIRVPRKLGGKSGLEKLNATVSENGGTLYADVAFQKVSIESEGKGYNYQAESAKYYGSGYVASFGQVNPGTLRQTSSLGYPETLYDLISPKFLVRYTDLFAEKFSKMDVDGISLRDLGSTLQSDKKRSNQIHREEALDVVTAALSTMQETGKSVMVNRANDYAWFAAEDIINLPLDDNDYLVVDANIPLYEMIVHGCIDYCGGVYNLANVSNDRQLILTMLEYGASPHFRFTWENATQMKYSGMNASYATTFSAWADKAAEVYAEVNGVLSRVSGESMVCHEILAGGVRKVTYSNSVIIYVNYSNEACTADGITIPALGYAVA